VDSEWSGESPSSRRSGSLSSCGSRHRGSRWSRGQWGGSRAGPSQWQILLHLTRHLRRGEDLNLNQDEPRVSIWSSGFWWKSEEEARNRTGLASSSFWADSSFLLFVFFVCSWSNLFGLTGSSPLGFKKSYPDPSLEPESPFFLWTSFFSWCFEELCSRRRPVNNSSTTRLSGVSLRDVDLRLLVWIEDTRSLLYKVDADLTLV
jgi:hypothetical protein